MGNLVRLSLKIKEGQYLGQSALSPKFYDQYPNKNVKLTFNNTFLQKLYQAENKATVHFTGISFEQDSPVTRAP